jgi:RNA polymerase sigma factor (sigma-70 family)
VPENFDDTQLGGRERGFPATSQALLARVRTGDFDSLCARYWKPVYRFIRLGWSKSNEDAKDLTQAFFLWLLEGEALSKYDPSRGSFRRYFKVLLSSFIGHEYEALQRLKRGGGRIFVPFDGLEVPTDDPNRAFDRAWAADLLNAAVERARRRLVDEGKERHFEVYRAYEMGPANATYAEVAARFGLREGDVRNYLFEVRERIRAEVRADVQDEDEWNELFGA